MVKGFAVVIRSDFRGRNLPAKKQIKHKLSVCLKLSFLP